MLTLSLVRKDNKTHGVFFVLDKGLTLSKGFSFVVAFPKRRTRSAEPS